MKNVVFSLFIIFSIFVSIQNLFAAPSAEERESMVRRYYREYLNRDCDSSGLQYWSNKIAQSGGDSVCDQIKSSEEGFVHGCYKHHMNRFAEDGGLRNWIKYLRQYGRDRCRNEIGKSDEASDLRRECVANWYREFLYREPDAGGMNFWCEHIFDHGFDYAKFRIQDSNEAFVQSCYREHLGRCAEPAGLQNWLTKLNSESRQSVYRKIQESGESKSVQQETTNSATINTVSDLKTLIEQSLSAQIDILNNNPSQDQFVETWKQISLLFDQDFNFVFNYIYNLFQSETDRNIKIAFAFILNDKRPNNAVVKNYLITEGFSQQRLDTLSNSDGVNPTMGLYADFTPIQRFNLRSTYSRIKTYYRFTHKILK